jgi:hypothetical protein
MTASRGATSERRRPGRGNAITRRGNPSALPEGPRQPCWRSSARVSEMYRVRVRTRVSRTVSRARTWRWAWRGGAQGGRLPADRPRPGRGRLGGLSSLCGCGWRTWGRSSGRPRSRDVPRLPDTGRPIRSRSTTRGGCAPALARPVPRRSAAARCGSGARSARPLRQDANLAFPLVHVDANMIHGWPPSPCASERVISLWGTVCHHVEWGVSRFIPSILLPARPADPAPSWRHWPLRFGR